MSCEHTESTDRISSAKSTYRSSTVGAHSPSKVWAASPLDPRKNVMLSFPRARNDFRTKNPRSLTQQLGNAGEKGESPENDKSSEESPDHEIPENSPDHEIIGTAETAEIEVVKPEFEKGQDDQKDPGQKDPVCAAETEEQKLDFSQKQIRTLIAEKIRAQREAAVTVRQIDFLRHQIKKRDGIIKQLKSDLEAPSLGTVVSTFAENISETVNSKWNFYSITNTYEHDDKEKIRTLRGIVTRRDEQVQALKDELASLKKYTATMEKIIESVGMDPKSHGE